MEKIHYIYGLYSTRKLNEGGMGKIKYIGRSSNPESRLKQHLSSIGKIDNILTRWMAHELAKDYKIKLTILDQCIDGNIVELEKQWIDKIGKDRKLLNTVSNNQNSVNILHKELKRLKAEVINNSKIINELTGSKRSRKLIKGIHLLDQTRSLNKELYEKVSILENYITQTLEKPLPYEVKRKGKRRKKRKYIGDFLRQNI
jgi:hypothetical protein